MKRALIMLVALCTVNALAQWTNPPTPSDAIPGRPTASYTAHIANTNNPHGTTPAQIGVGVVVTLTEGNSNAVTVTGNTNVVLVIKTNYVAGAGTGDMMESDWSPGIANVSDRVAAVESNLGNVSNRTGALESNLGAISNWGNHAAAGYAPSNDSRIVSNPATNAGAAGQGHYAMSNGAWVAFTPGVGGTGGGIGIQAGTNTLPQQDGTNWKIHVTGSIVKDDGAYTIGSEGLRFDSSDSPPAVTVLLGSTSDTHLARSDGVNLYRLWDESDGVPLFDATAFAIGIQAGTNTLPVKNGTNWTIHVINSFGDVYGTSNNTFAGTQQFDRTESTEMRMTRWNTNYVIVTGAGVSSLNGIYEWDGVNIDYFMLAPGNAANMIDLDVSGRWKIYDETNFTGGGLGWTYQTTTTNGNVLDSWEQYPNSEPGLSAKPRTRYGTSTGVVLTADGIYGGAAGTTNAITPNGLVDISALLGGTGGGITIAQAGAAATNTVNALAPAIAGQAATNVVTAGGYTTIAAAGTGWTNTVTDPCRTPTLVTYASTNCILSRTHGRWVKVILTNAAATTMLTFDTSYAATDVSLVDMVMYGTNAVAIDPTVTDTNAWAAVTVSATATNSIIWRKGLGGLWVPR